LVCRNGLLFLLLDPVNFFFLLCIVFLFFGLFLNSKGHLFFLSNR
jgi:hypothetical protein